MALSNLKGSISSNWGTSYKKSNPALSDADLGVTKSYPINYTFGSGANQANKAYSQELTVPASSTTTLDLDAGTLEDPFGDAVIFTKIKAFRVYHKDVTGGSTDIDVAGDYITTIYGASASFNLTDGSLLHMQDVDGSTVVAGTGDAIEIINNDVTNSATVIVDIIGD